MIKKSKRYLGIDGYKLDCLTTVIGEDIGEVYSYILSQDHIDYNFTVTSEVLDSWTGLIKDEANKRALHYIHKYNMRSLDSINAEYEQAQIEREMGMSDD